MRPVLLAEINANYSTHSVRMKRILSQLRDKFEVVISGSGPFMRLFEGYSLIETPCISVEEVSERTQKIIPRIFDRKIIDFYYEAELAAIKQVKPDIVFTEQFRDIGILAVHSSGRTPKPLDIRLRDPFALLQYHYEFVPEHFPHIIKKLLEFSGKKAFSKTEEVFKHLFAIPLRKKTKSLGILSDKREYIGIAPDLVLLPHLKELYPALCLPDNYFFTGPILESFGESPPWLREFLSHDKRIVASMGTTGKHDKSRIVIDALGNSEYAVALQDDPSKFRFPENFFLAKNINLEQVLNGAFVFINHGGVGSVYFGIAYGVPQLCVPNHMEQEVNSKHAVDAGVALALHSSRLTPENLRESIEELAANPYYSVNAQALSSKINREKSVELSCSLIEQEAGKHGLLS